MANVKPVVVGVDEAALMAETAMASPNWEKANSEFGEKSKRLTDKHDAAVKALNQEWADSFKTKAPLAYHQRSDIENRNHLVGLTALKVDLFGKHGLGNVPISEYEHRLWLESLDPRTKEIDKLAIERGLLSTKFMAAILGDINAAESKGVRLRYDVEGELGEFSPSTQGIWRRSKRIDKRLTTLRVDWPAQPAVVRVDGRKKRTVTVSVRSSVQRGKKGWLVAGKDNRDRRLSVFFLREDDAREFVRRVKEGEDSTNVSMDIFGRKVADDSGTSIAPLLAIHEARSPFSKSSDERQEHSLVVDTDDPRVEQWKRDPGRMDVRGVDTPKKGKRKKRSPRKTRQTKSGVTSLRSIRK